MSVYLEALREKKIRISLYTILYGVSFLSFFLYVYIGFAKFKVLYFSFAKKILRIRLPGICFLSEYN